MARHEPRFTLTTLEGLGAFVEVPASLVREPAGITPPPETLADGSSTTITSDIPVVRYNIAPGQDAWVVRGTRELAKLRWGLLPRWQGHGGKRPPMVHAAPLEAVAATPLLRDAFKKQRCLVLADGCYAWNSLKQPVWFHPEPRRVIALAGVWATNKDDDVPSFALLTGDPLLARVTEQMPIVIDEACYDVWLSGAPEEGMALCAPRALEGWRADPVTTRMANADHDDPKCIEPIGNPRQGELF